MADSYYFPVQRSVLDIVGKDVLFVNGQCLLCNWFVVWILKHNKKQSIIITSYQGRIAKSLLNENINKEFKEVISKVDSVAVLTADGRLLLKSEAILKILFLMGSFWKNLAIILKCIPVGLRDAFYLVVVKNRFKLYGRTKECQLKAIRNNKSVLN